MLELLVENHCVEITEILSYIFWRKFREINGHVKEVTKEMI